MWGIERVGEWMKEYSSSGILCDSGFGGQRWHILESTFYILGVRSHRSIYLHTYVVFPRVIAVGKYKAISIPKSNVMDFRDFLFLG